MIDKFRSKALFAPFIAVTAILALCHCDGGLDRSDERQGDEASGTSDGSNGDEAANTSDGLSVVFVP